jgi:chromosome segregation ATPase
MRDTIVKLEKENGHLTQELVASKAGMREEMDRLEERIDTLSKESRAHKTATEAAQLLIAELREELKQAKVEYQNVMVQLMEERVHNSATVSEYKQLAQQMDESHQKQVGELNQELIEVKAQCSMQQNTATSASRDPQQPDHPLSEHKATLSSEGKLRKLELELAQTKLALVESQCRNQELEKRLEGSTSNSSSRSTKGSFLGRGKKKT